MIRYHARWVLPVASDPIANGCVAVDGERIAYVGRRADAPAGRDEELGEVVLLPGLVNAHTHLELTAFRGLLEDLPFREWIVSLQAAKRAVMSPDDFLDAARLGIAEGLLAGITTYADTCDSGAALPAMREMGVRGIMYAEVFGPHPADEEESLAALRAKVEHGRAHVTARTILGVSPHAPYTVSDALYRAVARYARAERLPIAVHIAESDAEHRFVRDGEGPFADGHRRRDIPVVPRAPSPIALLDALGVLDERPLLIHCVYADAGDIAAIVRHDCAVAHCPISNAKLGHGVAPILPMLDAGVRVGLGSDSMASNNAMDLLAEARAALLAQRAHSRDHFALTAAQALHLATLGGARALGLDREIGSLEPGKSADLVAFPLDPARAPHYDPITSLIHAPPGGALLVLVAGRPLVRDGTLLHADPDLAARNASLGSRLRDWKEAGR